MTKPRLELRRLQTEGYVRFTRIQRQLDEHLAELFDDEQLQDITPRQAQVLMVLFNGGKPLSARRIAEALAISEVTAGRFVHALSKAGWVSRKRDPSDARSMLVSPTKKAYKHLPRFIQVSNLLLDGAFAGFSRKEIESLVSSLQRLADNLGHGAIQEYARLKTDRS